MFGYFVTVRLEEFYGIYVIFSNNHERREEGWRTYVAWPNSIDFLGSGKAEKVLAKAESYEFVVTCLPRGDGTHFLPLSKVVMKSIGKTAGETVVIEVRRLK